MEDLPARVRRLLEDFIVGNVDVARGEAELDYLEELTPEERRFAIELLLLNLQPPRSTVLLGLAALGAREVVPTLVGLLTQVDSLSRRIEIARCLTTITQDPTHLRTPLSEAMDRRGDPNIKAAHFSDIQLLPAGEQVEMLLHLLDDRDSLVRAHTLRELNALYARKQYVSGDLPLKLKFFKKHRNDPELHERLTQAAAESRLTWEPVF